MLQQPTKVAEHLAADSIAGHAIDKAVSAGGIVNWKIAVTILVAAILVGVLVLFVMEWNSIKKAGGLKKWVDDVPIVQYRTVRLIWISEGIVIVLTLAVVAHAVWPQVVGEIQTDMVYAIFAFLGFGQGMNVTAFIGKRATEDPVIAATNAAINDPNVTPLVTSNKKTGDRSVSSVPNPVYVTQTNNPVPNTTSVIIPAVPVVPVAPVVPPTITRDA